MKQMNNKVVEGTAQIARMTVKLEHLYPQPDS